jgi:hypothetical protein
MKKEELPSDPQMQVDGFPDPPMLYPGSDPYAGVGGSYELNMVTGERKPISKVEAP